MNVVLLTTRPTDEESLLSKLSGKVEVSRSRNTYIGTRTWYEVKREMT